MTRADLLHRCRQFRWTVRSTGLRLAYRLDARRQLRDAQYTLAGIRRARRH